MKDTLENFTVEFETAPKESNWKRLQGILLPNPKKLFNSFKTTLLLIKHKNMLEPLEKSQCPFSKLWNFSTPFYSPKITSNPDLMKAILKHARIDPEEGLFHDKITPRLFLPILKDLFPDENITSDDFLFTTKKNLVGQYRQPILQFIGQRCIDKHSHELETIVNDTVAQWEALGNDKPINISTLSFTFATNMISKFLLGHPGPEKVYEEIASSAQCVSSTMMKTVFWKKSLSKEEKTKYFHSLAIFRKAIDTTLSLDNRSSNSFIKALREKKELSELQVKLSLFLMYFAGTDAPGGLLSYMIWQLGQRPDYQQKILEELKNKKDSFYETATQLQTVENLFYEGIRLYTPIYIITRYPREDTVCTIKDNQGKTVLQEKISKKFGLACCPYLAAKDSVTFKDPETFDPSRFEKQEKKLSWLPFGDGKHTCPGQWITKAEIVLLITKLVQDYEITSFPSKEPQKKGYLTIQPEVPYYLSLKKRTAQK